MRIAIIDSSPNQNMNMPIPFRKDLEYDTHPYYMLKEFERTNAMDCQGLLSKEEIEGYEVFLLPDSSTSFRWMLDNDIQMCIMSLNEWMRLIYKEAIDKELMYSDKILMLTSAGNSGAEGLTGAARREAWLAIGAVDQNNNPKYYSSYGNGEVFGVAQDGFDGHNGTSFANPRFGGLIRFFYMIHYKYFDGYYPSPKVAIKWAKQNCHDIWEEGHDIKTGYGLLKLPNIWEMRDTIVNIDNPSTRIERKFRNGIIKEKEVTNKIEGKMIDNRLMLGVRDIGEGLKLTVHYDNETRNAHFSTV